MKNRLNHIFTRHDWRRNPEVEEYSIRYTILWKNSFFYNIRKKDNYTEYIQIKKTCQSLGFSQLLFKKDGMSRLFVSFTFLLIYLYTSFSYVSPYFHITRNLFFHTFIIHLQVLKMTSLIIVVQCLYEDLLPLTFPQIDKDYSSKSLTVPTT